RCLVIDLNIRSSFDRNPWLGVCLHQLHSCAITRFALAASQPTAPGNTKIRLSSNGDHVWSVPCRLRACGDGPLPSQWKWLISVNLIERSMRKGGSRL